MIGNFRIVSGATVPWLESIITKDGIVPMFTQAPTFNCNDPSAVVDPNVLDLEKVTQVQFEMYKCGRNLQQVSLQGIAEKVQSTVTEGSGDTEVVKKVNLGLVRYKWHPQDTTIKGLYYGRFKLTFEDSTIMYWPYQMESLSIEVM